MLGTRLYVEKRAFAAAAAAQRIQLAPDARVDCLCHVSLSALAGPCVYLRGCYRHITCGLRFA